MTEIEVLKIKLGFSREQLTKMTAHRDELLEKVASLESELAMLKKQPLAEWREVGGLVGALAPTTPQNEDKPEGVVVEGVSGGHSMDVPFTPD